MDLSLHISFAIARISCFAALVVPPSSYRPLFIVPVVLNVLYFFRSVSEYHNPFQYSYASFALQDLFLASSFILITDVQRELFIKGQKVPAHHLPFTKRVKWAVKLWVSTRCIGWTHEPTHALPPPPPPSVTPTAYLNQQVFALIRDLVFYDACVTYAKHSPNFTIDGYSITEDGIYWRTLNVLLVGSGAFISILIPHRVYCILCVYLGISKPQDCVPLFGDLRDAYTLRNFWGRVWHQMMRWLGVSHGRFLAYKVLRLKRGSKASFLVQLYTTFAVSALIHVAGEYSMLGYWTHRHALRFFLLQPVAITLETMVIGQTSKSSVRWPLHFIGYLWVIMWFVYLTPGWIDPLLRGGLAQTIPSLGIFDALLKTFSWGPS